MKSKKLNSDDDGDTLSQAKYVCRFQYDYLKLKMYYGFVMMLRHVFPFPGSC